MNPRRLSVSVVSVGLSRFTTAEDTRTAGAAISPPVCRSALGFRFAGVGLSVMAWDYIPALYSACPPVRGFVIPLLGGGVCVLCSAVKDRDVCGVTPLTVPTIAGCYPICNNWLSTIYYFTFLSIDGCVFRAYRTMRLFGGVCVLRRSLCVPVRPVSRSTLCAVCLYPCAASLRSGGL